MTELLIIMEKEDCEISVSEAADLRRTDEEQKTEKHMNWITGRRHG